MSYNMSSYKAWKSTISSSIFTLTRFRKEAGGKFPFDCLIGAGRSGGVVGAVLAYELEMDFIYWGHEDTPWNKSCGLIPDRRPGPYPSPSSLPRCNIACMVDDLVNTGKCFRSIQRGLLGVGHLGRYARDINGQPKVAEWGVDSFTGQKYPRKYKVIRPGEGLRIGYIFVYPFSIHKVTDHPVFEHYLRFPGDEVMYPELKHTGKPTPPRDKYGRFVRTKAMA